ncbi:hypothetical protein GCK72_004302 [Caenorhabditis remanei]|uniref:Thioredoxin-like fold domain-containing protein n=1 Tax=Caenorhabditis remanei TaxID=31234 RepID=A0A6A5HAW9_CAERE|nr:hypothetical protein GCK72_004302 [Caenorhabditis remanei]KAF1764355.1 hypothetical protein GCK72_004302 [Caenorhabditis remanei]
MSEKYGKLVLHIIEATETLTITKTTTGKEQLEDKMVAFVFTHGSPSFPGCVGFENQISTFYEAVKANHPDFELVYIPAQIYRTPEDHHPKNYTFCLAKLRDCAFIQLAKNYGITIDKIPQILIIRANGDAVVRMTRWEFDENCEQPEELWDDWNEKFHDPDAPIHMRGEVMRGVQTDPEILKALRDEEERRDMFKDWKYIDDSSDEEETEI